MAKSKIYTRKGDDGSTSLVGGRRIPKTSRRIDAYGTIDELNSFIACLLEEINEREDYVFLVRIQSGLFTLGSYLASEPGYMACQISEEEITNIESKIDQIDELLPPLKYFILPGGSKSSALAHVCRTICRRAERCIYKLREMEEIDENVLKYINRLSDYFFLLARKQNFINNIGEKIWESPCK